MTTNARVGTIHRAPVFRDIRRTVRSTIHNICTVIHDAAVCEAVFDCIMKTSTSRRATWLSPNGKYHNQIDYIMVRKRFRSSVNIAKTRSFPGADIGSDHELVMMTFKLHLKRVKKVGHTRIKFDLEKLKDPEVAEAFHAMIGGKFAALTILDADGTYMETLINTFNTAVPNTASEILGTHRPVKKPWVTADLLDLCDKRRELKKKKKDAEGVRQYRAVNQEINKRHEKNKDGLD